jgi:CRP/FNR family transcriptional regulator
VALEQALSRQLVRTAEAAAMSAPVSSEVRLARFLLWLSQCMADAGQSPRRLLLRMGRRDIASLLCVAHETVSRGFTNLATVGYVLARRKEVEILDPEGLRDFARFTRGTPPDTLRRPVAGHAQAAPCRRTAFRAPCRPTGSAACRRSGRPRTTRFLTEIKVPGR